MVRSQIDRKKGHGEPFGVLPSSAAQKLTVPANGRRHASRPRGVPGLRRRENCDTVPPENRVESDTVGPVIRVCRVVLTRCLVRMETDEKLELASRLSTGQDNRGQWTRQTQNREEKKN